MNKLDLKSLNNQFKQDITNDQESPQDLSPYAFKAKLIDILDFSKVDFNKAISLNPINSQGEGKIQNSFENCKFELVKLGKVCDLFNGYAFKKPTM
ncbi:hypothetical protein V3Y64_000196 [Campylobacter upsaliensis]|uniref:Uncharacterized protein n=1 Tax=Campylobacter upsaliensis TaxID=28080 RepID=A0A5L8XGQ3_CAMUP|nr:hypothetical protein [Campylobacter upsaliensis]EAI4338811.1 hypothetical protein [Campylobacter upsaliensis]EAJ0466637.1 hypothetical protein [Campylobacter upsaliensis]EAJ0885771.1 hypothetical protein [Campylobacter upsaliensis]EAK6514172.1 hypothetical protein [Campylobacter upsaliensis]